MAARAGTMDTRSVAKVSDRLDSVKPITAVSVEETEVALRVSDCGRATLAADSFGALAIGTTAGSLASFNTNKVDLICPRGIQLKSSVANTGTIVIGGSSVSYNATASSINGLPLSPGESIFLEVTQLSAIYADASASGQVLHWIAY